MNSIYDVFSFIFLQKTLNPLTTLLQTSISIENKEYLCSNLIFLFYYKLQQNKKKRKIVR